ncbi:Zinc finger, GRF-type [Sesbania bispinosa]|nr:Zinc finger, GRF-type [Sesbania bispinosa]
MRLCGCGDEIVTLTTGSVKNPGRKFFRCPNWKNKGSCNFFQWLDEEFRGGEGEGTVGGQCNCSQILIERLTTKISKKKRKMMEERKKVKILKAIVVGLMVLLATILVAVICFFN